MNEQGAPCLIAILRTYMAQFARMLALICFNVPNYHKYHAELNLGIFPGFTNPAKNVADMNAWNANKDVARSKSSLRLICSLAALGEGSSLDSESSFRVPLVPAFTFSE